MITKTRGRKKLWYDSKIINLMNSLILFILRFKVEYQSLHEVNDFAIIPEFLSSSCFGYHYSVTTTTNVATLGDRKQRLKFQILFVLRFHVYIERRYHLESS